MRILDLDAQAIDVTSKLGELRELRKSDFVILRHCSAQMAEKLSAMRVGRDRRTWEPIYVIPGQTLGTVLPPFQTTRCAPCWKVKPCCHEHACLNRLN
jgi:hypothetical protein